MLQSFVAQAVTIPSTSMVPTLNVNDKLIINKMIKPENLNYGDIVVFFSPIGDERYIKRLMGVGGDTVEVREGCFYRNGKEIQETYLAESIEYEFGPTVIPESKYFFLGDNRNISFDSHLWPDPFIEESEIIGKAVFRYYPFNEIEKFQ